MHPLKKMGLSRTSLILKGVISGRQRLHKNTEDAFMPAIAKDSYLRRDPHDSRWPLRWMEDYPVGEPSGQMIHGDSDGSEDHQIYSGSYRKRPLRTWKGGHLRRSAQSPLRSTDDPLMLMENLPRHADGVLKPAERTLPNSTSSG